MTKKPKQKRKVDALSPFTRTALPIFACVLLVCASSLGALSLYGTYLEDTVIYRNLSERLPPILDTEFMGATLMMIGMLLFFALRPDSKIGSIGIVQSRPGVQRAMSVAGATLILAGIVLAFLELPLSAYRSSAAAVAFANLNGFLLTCVTVAFGLTLLYLALVPIRLFEAIAKTFLVRFAAFLAAGAIFLLVALSLEASQHRPQQEVIAEAGGKPVRSTHSISTILDGIGDRVGASSSSAVTLRFRMTPFNPQEPGPRYPVALDPQRKYSVSADISGSGFQISNLPEPVAKPRFFEVGELKTWTWTVSPSSSSAGSRQHLLVQVFLHDRDTGALVYSSPVVSHRIEVRTPLGLPAWLVSPSITIGLVLGALIMFAWTFFAQRLQITTRE